jgi:rhamnogalacturonan endolyase
MGKIRLIQEDFKAFKIGYFPSDISAIGEYHYYPPKGYTGIWYEPNKDTSWQGKPCWMIKEREGIHELEQEKNIRGETTLPMLIAGDREWENYRLEGSVWPLTLTHLCGLGFRYIDSRHFYLFALTGGSEAVLYKKCEEELIILSKVDFPYDCDHIYRLAVETLGNSIECQVDGKTVLTIKDDSYSHGKIAVVAAIPARFSDITLDMEQQEYFKVQESQRINSERIAKKRKEYPHPVLSKVINLKDFGAARSIRYGDLTGNGQIDFLFVQNMMLLNTGDECMISCITAVDLDGNVLWQIGEPDPENCMITADVPIQIYDIDGDGMNEVIYCKDFKIIVADGRTGKTKYWAPTPESIPHKKFKIYQNITLKRIVGDSISICNFSGNEHPSDILIKDRYNNVWAYDRNLKPLWHRYVNSGHFPYGYDINGDGRDELMVGHTLLSSDGELIWELPDMRCHVDEIVIGRFDPEYDKQMIALASGEDGFLLVDEDGKILVQDHIGHAQRVSVANYRPDLPGLEICVTTFWRNTGIIVYYDCKGRRIYSCEPGANGNVICPVNWTGDGRELILYSANNRYGGLMDGYGDPVVVLPDDGHPDLCCDAVDLLGDEREEILAWDSKRMYIYTQSDNPKEVNYIPEKYPIYNYSNYRGEFSFPRWKAGSK